MNKDLNFLITYLLEERNEHVVLEDDDEQNFKLFRTLVNTRKPKPISEQWLEVQDAFLKGEIEKKGITKMKELIPINKNMYLWQGDITTLQTDAIVNSSDEKLLGCFYPCHNCLNNAIHTYEGVRLRLQCKDIIKKQGHSECIGNTKVTKCFNLPAEYIIHTVVPRIEKEIDYDDIEDLRACYRSCLQASKSYEIKNIAFPCLSTGNCNFPNSVAAKIAIGEVIRFQNRGGIDVNVLFNVFTDEDHEIYSKYLVNTRHRGQWLKQAVFLWFVLENTLILASSKHKNTQSTR